MLTGVSRSTGIELENNLVLFSTVYIISEICWLVGIYIWVLLKNRSRWFLLLCFTTWPAIVVMAALTDKSFIQPGGYAYTFNKRSGTITAFVDFNSQKAFSKALDINDYFGLTECRSTGKAFDLSPHTHVLVLDAHHDMRQLRVLSGPNTGRAGWVNKNCLSSTVK
jgi:hypothetical protein